MLIYCCNTALSIVVWTRHGYLSNTEGLVVTYRACMRMLSPGNGTPNYLRFYDDTSQFYYLLLTIAIFAAEGSFLLAR